MISVVIPTLNEEKTIGTLLNALAKQDLEEGLEVVVADAGSKDRTKAIAESYKKYFDNLSVVKGGMPAVGRNNGAKASKGNPIFFIDADMIIPEVDFLKKATDYFRKNNLGIATVYLRPKSNFWIDHVMVALYNFWLPISKYLRASGSMCIVASREIFVKSGGYPEDVVMSEDHDFVYKSSKLGKYDVIPLYLEFSLRRFNKEGRLVILWKYLLAALHTIFIGPIRRDIFKYEFGNFEEKHEKRN